MAEPPTPTRRLNRWSLEEDLGQRHEGRWFGRAGSGRIAWEEADFLGTGPAARRRLHRSPRRRKTMKEGRPEWHRQS